NNLLGIDMASASVGFGVGAGGAIVTYNGTSWSNATSPTATQLNGVALNSTTGGFAVGNAGVIIRLVATTWSTIASPTGNALNGVDMISASDGFAVGSGGVIVRWNGTSWATFGSPTGNALNGVDLISSTDGFAVGSGGVIIRWNGAAWSTVTSPTASNLRAVFMFSSSNGWAVGDGGTMIKWNGTSWTNYAGAPPTVKNLFDVILTSQNPHDGWIVGAQGVFLRDPTPPFQLNGTFLSSVLDVDPVSADWDALFFTPILPVPTTLTIAVRSGNTAVPDGTWSAFSAEISTTAGAVIPVPMARYLQYRATLATSDNNQTPQLDDITISYRK
ncbi:MAG: hypothetical protein AAB692_05835, partial [Patescibacteria group bacterium]